MSASSAVDGTEPPVILTDGGASWQPVNAALPPAPSFGRLVGSLTEGPPAPTTRPMPGSSAFRRVASGRIQGAYDNDGERWRRGR